MKWAGDDLVGAVDRLVCCQRTISIRTDKQWRYDLSKFNLIPSVVVELITQTCSRSERYCFKATYQNLNWSFILEVKLCCNLDKHHLPVVRRTLRDLHWFQRCYLDDLSASVGSGAAKIWEYSYVCEVVRGGGARQWAVAVPTVDVRQPVLYEQRLRHLKIVLQNSQIGIRLINFDFCCNCVSLQNISRNFGFNPHSLEESLVGVD